MKRSSTTTSSITRRPHNLWLRITGRRRSLDTTISPPCQQSIDTETSLPSSPKVAQHAPQLSLTGLDILEQPPYLLHEKEVPTIPQIVITPPDTPQHTPCPPSVADLSTLYDTKKLPTFFVDECDGLLTAPPKALKPDWGFAVIDGLLRYLPDNIEKRDELLEKFFRRRVQWQRLGLKEQLTVFLMEDYHRGICREQAEERAEWIFCRVFAMQSCVGIYPEVDGY